MYVHHDAKVIYLAHPRTASASTAEALQTIGFEKPTERDHHCKIYGPRSPVTPENRGSWFAFTAIRNHWDAAVSWGYMSHAPNEAEEWNLEVFKRVLDTPWIEPNKMWWHDQDADVILRFERLQEDLDLILKILKLPTVILPKKNISDNRIVQFSGESRSYRDYFDAASRGYVQKRFEDEILQYGYSF